MMPLNKQDECGHDLGATCIHHACGLSAPRQTLEGLPPEILLHIFQSGQVGLEDLRAALRASPILYRQYRDFDRSQLLRAGIEGSLGPVVVDAWAAFIREKIDLVLSQETAKERSDEL